MNVCSLTANLVCEFFLNLIILCLFPANLIRQIFLGLMRSAKFDENMVSAALQRMKESLGFFGTRNDSSCRTRALADPRTHEGLLDLCEQVPESLLSLLPPYLNSISQ